MSTEFYVELKSFNEWNKLIIPPELIAEARDRRLQIGACYSNSDRGRTLANLLQEKYGEWSEGTFSHVRASVEELKSSKKPYFSKWSRKLPLEFFETKLRFCWHIPMNLQEPAEEDVQEDYQKAMLEFWNTILEDTAPIYHSSLHQINTWKDLKEAIFGDERYMEPSRFVQGTIRLF